MTIAITASLNASTRVLSESLTPGIESRGEGRELSKAWPLT
jgi:hypothetical protein